MNATPTKLRDGTWGAKVTGTDARSVSPGASLTITSRAGKSWTAKVTRVVWRGDDAAIVATSSGGSGSSGGGETCWECGRSGARIRCADSSGITGVCCPRCASLQPYERSFA